MLRNRFSAKLIGLLLTTLFFSGLQSVSAVEIKETDISTADTCSVSLKSVWSSYGVPHPCFTNGTALKMKTPPQSKLASSYYIRLNSGSRAIVTGAYVSIANYKSGLNEIIFEKPGATAGQWVEVLSTNFIIYTPVTSTRLRVAAVSKSPYVVTLNPGSTTANFVAAIGAASNEYFLKSLLNSTGQSVQEVLVVDLSADQ